MSVFLLLMPLEGGESVRVKRCRWKWERVKLRKWRMWWASETSRSKRLNQCCRKCALLRLNHSFLCHVWLLSNNSMTKTLSGIAVVQNFKWRFKDFKWQSTFSTFWSSWSFEGWNLSIWVAFFRDALISCKVNLSLQDFFSQYCIPLLIECRHWELIINVSTVMDTELNLTIQLICVSPQCQYRSVRREGVRFKIPLYCSPLTSSSTL